MTLSAAGDRYQLAALLIDVEREYRDGPDCPDVRVMLKMALIILGAAVPWIVESVALSW